MTPSAQAAPAGYDEEVAPPPKGYDEEVPPPAGTELTSTGIAVPQGMVGPSATGPDSVVGGVIRRGVDTVKGMASTFGPKREGENAFTSLPAYRIGVGLGEGIKTAGKQAYEQGGQAIDAAKSGDYYSATLRGAQAGVTALSALDPFATGPVTNINKLTEEGKFKEALGQGGFDALTLMLGRKTGETPSLKQSVNKMAYASGQEVRSLSKVAPDIIETVSKSGPPKTVGELLKTVQDTSTRLDNQFNVALQQVGPVHTQQIANALKAKASALPRSAAAEAAELNNAAKLYDGQVTTARELNADRMYRNANLKGFYNKGMTGQMAAVKSQAATMVDEIVAKESRDLLYSEMDRKFPGQNFKDLKLKQSSLLDILDGFEDHVSKLETKQASRAGAPLSEKASISASAHPGGSIVTPRFHGLMEMIPGAPGPLDRANSAAASAFQPTVGASIRRAAILSMPIGALTTGDDRKGRPAAIPPPPQP